jgi:hypothetical protein
MQINHRKKVFKKMEIVPFETLSPKCKSLAKKVLQQHLPPPHPHRHKNRLLRQHHDKATIMSSTKWTIQFFIHSVFEFRPTMQHKDMRFWALRFILTFLNSLVANAGEILNKRTYIRITLLRQQQRK